MSSRVLLGILVALLLGAGAYTLLPGPCETPLLYAIGSVDPRFGLSHEDFKADIDRAAAIWNSALGKELFAYDPGAELTISLVYDRRQELTEKEQELSANISATQEVADSVRAQYTALRAQYEKAEATYTSGLTEFEQAQTAYNKRVEYWNAKGGAPKGPYEALLAEKDALLALQDSLEEKRQEVNRLADTVNAYIGKYNLLVAAINTDVNTINNDGLAGTQFEEGLYISDRDGARIEIYQFEDAVDRIRVLAHELGHAHELSHNENPDSIMNPINQSETLELSPEDLQSIMARCGLTA